jgi:NADH:ubiquinone oxidoreductase subunit F (NADH-binding)
VNQVHLVADQLRPAAAGTREGILESAVQFDAHRPTLLAGPSPDSLPDHRARFGPWPDTDRPVDRARRRTGSALLEHLADSGLAGRGGGHVAAAVKWRAVLAAGGGGTVVANGAEGEPASAKDAALLIHRPHLVLDGLACAAAALGATRTVVWLHDGAISCHRAVAVAVDERRAAGILEPAVQIMTGPDAYLSGESSAVVSAVSGGPALPQFRRARGDTRGVDGSPILVHNVETLARVALVARSQGSGAQDTSLVTVLAGGRRTVLELDPSTTVAAAVARAPWTGGRPQAVLLGGYGGSWLPWTTAADLPLDHDGLQAAGAGLGAGVIAPLPAQACGLTETAAVVDYLARAGAGQCGPCVFGLLAIADLLLDLAGGRGGRGHLRRLHRYAGQVAGRGACHHPDGAMRLVWTALATFPQDIAAHTRGRCLHADTPAVLPIPAQAQAAASGGLR